jgi:hypothetical protein
MVFLASVALSAQGHGASGSVSGSRHSNAPSDARAASSDRDKGTDRAADEGKGKHKGLKKHHSPKRADGGFPAGRRYSAPGISSD